jgi:hypothetical protein
METQTGYAKVLEVRRTDPETVPRKLHLWMKAHVSTLISPPYFMPSTIEVGPLRCSTDVLRNPASRIQHWQSAPV